MPESEIYRLLNNLDTLETLQNIYFESEELKNIVKEIDFTEVLFKHGVKKFINYLGQQRLIQVLRWIYVPLIHL